MNMDRPDLGRSRIPFGRRENRQIGEWVGREADYAYIHTHMHSCIYTHTYIYTYTHIYMNIYMTYLGRSRIPFERRENRQIGEWVGANRTMHIYIHIGIATYIHIHRYIYTHIYEYIYITHLGRSRISFERRGNRRNRRVSRAQVGLTMHIYTHICIAVYVHIHRYVYTHLYIWLTWEGVEFRLDD